MRVYEPAPARSGNQRPVLILFDGQNVFDDHGSYAGGWYAHRAADRLGQWRPTPPLIVGVDHGGVARIDELTPFRDGRRGGKLPALIEALVTELLPRLHARFDLAYGPGGHSVGGSSLGGLAALYTHLSRPDVFGGAICMSPSLWFTGARVDAFVRHTSTPLRSRIYLDAGAREGRGQTFQAARNLAEHLSSRGWAPPADRRDLRVLLRRDARGRHDERSWRRRFPKALRFISEP